MCFDWLFNMQIPDPTDRVHIVRPSAGTFCTGLARAYDETYDAVVLGKYISKGEYTSIVSRINDTLENYFPCPLCWCFGYFMAIFTLGLSLLCPMICVNDAETNVRQFIASCNRKKLNNKNLTLVLRKKCGTSWLELHLPPPPAEGQAKPEMLPDEEKGAMLE